MKKFVFQLDTVLDYKEQMLDTKKGEHAVALKAVKEQEEILSNLIGEFDSYKERFKEKSSAGITILEAMNYESYMTFLRERIKQEKLKLDELLKYENLRREAVVEAKMETSTIEKLKKEARVRQAGAEESGTVYRRVCFKQDGIHVMQIENFLKGGEEDDQSQSKQRKCAKDISGSQQGNRRQISRDATGDGSTKAVSREADKSQGSKRQGGRK